MSARAGYSAEFMESLGKCRECGGSESYPMLVTEEQICKSDFHNLKYRIASIIFKMITGRKPPQARKQLEEKVK